MVSLESNSVAENLENYMAKSEQLRNQLPIFAADSKKLGGLIIQKMPSVGGNVSEISDPDAWGRILQLAHTVTKDELLNVPATDVLHRLFWQEKLVPVAETDIAFWNATAPATRLTACCCSWASRDAWIFWKGQKARLKLTADSATASRFTRLKKWKPYSWSRILMLPPWEPTQKRPR